ncbi:MAG: TatD family hydrolase [Solidesulfovibrio sp.]|uniref:TatD family hydrolase n=1 Tax=Solidesulfovibrio sp. TaxID=2910990 RepID=UPI002B1FCFDE|nr:TatD family hydrolase [Solidesulfovibrio sp.]MEA4857589.1 TatD family hydrolase [Solidesulfovibrio sp.]
MDVIDAHTHLDELPWETLQNMSMSGIRAIISPVQLMCGKALGAKTIREVWDYLFDVQFARAEKNHIKPYAMIGISMVATPADDPAELYAALPEYLKRPEVVAIGEIGIEPGSRTCKDLKLQEEFVVRQLAIAKDADICVDFHMPNPAEAKKEYTQKILGLCRDCGLSMAKVVIDHCTDANIGMVLDAGAWPAVSVQPWRPVTPATAVEYIKRFGADKIILDSDSSMLPSDPLAVPKTAFALKSQGFSDADIEKVCALNCKTAYAIA